MAAYYWLEIHRAQARDVNPLQTPMPRRALTPEGISVRPHANRHYRSPHTPFRQPTGFRARKSTLPLLANAIPSAIGLPGEPAHNALPHRFITNQSLTKSGSRDHSVGKWAIMWAA